MGKRNQGKTVGRKRPLARDLTTKAPGINGGVIVYNGHAGLGTNGIVTDNKDPDRLSR